ncbi:MAG: aspartate 1-decarboxylase [Gammaproteobacteria bacterium]|nr:aspartate 1-decarboxylase [Gammaproteobacteria bacterium]
MITVLKAKLHRAVVTHAERDYEGSCAIDESLLQMSGIREYEQIHIYNLENGDRFSTYAIRAQRESGVVSVNGAAAHRAAPGQRVIICAYRQIEEAKAAGYQPIVICLDDRNQVNLRKGGVPLPKSA